MSPLPGFVSKIVEGEHPLLGASYAIAQIDEAQGEQNYLRE